MKNYAKKVLYLKDASHLFHNSRTSPFLQNKFKAHSTRRKKCKHRKPVVQTRTFRLHVLPLMTMTGKEIQGHQPLRHFCQTLLEVSWILGLRLQSCDKIIIKSLFLVSLSIDGDYCTTLVILSVSRSASHRALIHIGVLFYQPVICLHTFVDSAAFVCG